MLQSLVFIKIHYRIELIRISLLDDETVYLENLSFAEFTPAVLSTTETLLVLLCAGVCLTFGLRQRALSMANKLSSKQVASKIIIWDTSRTDISHNDYRLSLPRQSAPAYSRSNLNSSVNFKSYLVIGNLMSHTQSTHKGLLMIGLSFVKNVRTNCTLIPILPGNFLRSKIGRF